MPYWPFPMAVAAILLALGLRYGGWVAPLVVLGGYVAMRGVMAWVPVPLVEVASCTLWLAIAFVLCYKGAWVPGFFYALSGLTYPALLVFGFRIEYMGLSPVISAAFGLIALIGIGGGIIGLALDRNNRDMDHGGILVRFSDNPLGLATRKMRD